MVTVRLPRTPSVAGTVILLALFVAVALVRLWSELPFSEEPLFFRASRMYLRDLGPEALLMRGRAPLVPLVFHLLGRDPQLIAIMQIGVSIVAWSLLAWSAHSFVGGGRRGLIAAGLILLLGASGRVSLWDRTMMLESISLSLLALVVAAALGYERSGQLKFLVLFLIASGIWVMARESNYLGVGLIAAALLIPRAKLHRLRHGAALLAVVGLIVFADWRIDGAGRWVFSFYNVVGARVLPDEDAVRFLQDRGMPVSPALLRMAGRDGGDDERFFYNSPELSEWRDWVQDEGRRSYALFLLAHPLASLKPLVSDFDTIFGVAAGEFRSRGDTAAGSPARAPYVAPFGEWLDDLLEWRGLSLILLAAFVAAVFQSLRPSSRLLLPLFPALLVVVGIPFGLILWHADAMGTARHCLPAAVIQWIGLILVLTGARLRPRTDAVPHGFAPRASR